MSTIARAATVARKVAAQARLLRRDPEAFARNVTQYTDPTGYLDRLLDLPTIRPVTPSVDCPGPPRVNVLLPAIGPTSMTGGPNTVIQIGCAIARAGTGVRFVSCDQPVKGGKHWFWRHVEHITLRPPPPNVSLQDAISDTFSIGKGDLFLASFWTTAHQANRLLPFTDGTQFLYLIQDFEPGFYPFSSRYAMALETYGFPHQPIVNQAVLADHLAASKVGRFGLKGFRERCITFEPAIDRQVFRPLAKPAHGSTRKTLLVYARPSNPRNMLGLAVEAIRLASSEGAFAGDWRILAIGSRGSLPNIQLPSGVTINDAPWASYQDYARVLREADILLCPMLSPHTSYPVLEMAACGGIGVTTTFGTKTAAKLGAISHNILAADPNARSLADTLHEAVRLACERRLRDCPVNLPQSWEEALDPVGAAVARMIAAK